MVWALIKRKPRGLRFANAGVLFAVLRVWEEIPQDMIDNLCRSFPPRYQVCIELSRSSLNGYWCEVNRVYHGLDRENALPEPTIAEE
jgi:hypothetical protein